MFAKARTHYQQEREADVSLSRGRGLTERSQGVFLGNYSADTDALSLTSLYSLPLPLSPHLFLSFHLIDLNYY